MTEVLDFIGSLLLDVRGVGCHELVVVAAGEDESSAVRSPMRNRLVTYGGGYELGNLMVGHCRRHQV